MAERDDWLMSALAAQDAYRGDDPPWPEPPRGDDALLPPPRNPAAPPQGFVQEFFPHLADPATYGAAPPPSMIPNAAGKVPSSDTRLTGALADAGNALNYAIPMGGPVAGGAKAAAAIGGLMARRLPGMLERAAPKMSELAEPIRAYHSSPHDFEKFDLSKIGTGEGAQSYGHGTYAAENPAVSGQGGEYWQQFARRFEGTSEGYAANVLQSSKFDRGRATTDLDRLLKTYGSNSPPIIQEARDLLAGNKPVGPRTYEVAIHAKPEQFLDWDRPLNSQAPHVQDALRQFGFKADKEGLQSFDDALLRNLQSENLTPLPKQPPNPLGGDIYSALEAQRYRIGSGRGGGKPEASAALYEAGIPGIRYLDAGSRSRADLPMIEAEHSRLMKLLEGGVDEYGRSIGSRRAALQLSADNLAKDIANARNNAGTSNYVIFDPARISILKKYGLAGAVPTMGALATEDRYAE